MKCILGLLGCILLSGANAFSGDNGRSIKSLVYMPAPGTAYANLGYVSRTRSLNINTAANTNLQNSKFDDSVIPFEVGYGIVDMLSLSLSGNYFSGSKETDNLGPASSTPNTTQSGNANGLDDPYLTATVRLLDGKSLFMNFDVIAGYSPSTANAKSASVNPPITGTKVRGGSQTRVGARLGKEFGPFSLSASYDLYSSAKQASTDPSTNQSTETTGADSSVLGVNVQFELSDMFQILAFGGTTTNAKSTATNTTTQSQIVEDTNTTQRMGVGLNLQLVQEKLLLQLAYSTGTGSNHSLNASGVPLTVADSASSSYGLALLAQF